MFPYLNRKAKEDIEEEEEDDEEEEAKAYDDRLHFIRSIGFSRCADEEDGKKKKPKPHSLVLLHICYVS